MPARKKVSGRGRWRQVARCVFYGHGSTIVRSCRRAERRCRLPALAVVAASRLGASAAVGAAGRLAARRACVVPAFRRQHVHRSRVGRRDARIPAHLRPRLRISTRVSGRAPRRAAGFRAMILTAKHHGVSAVWPTPHDEALGCVGVHGGQGRATWCASLWRRARAESLLSRGCTCRPGIATIPVLWRFPSDTTTSTSTSFVSCSPTTARFTRSGSMVRTAKAPSGATGRQLAAVSAMVAGRSPPRRSSGCRPRRALVRQRERGRRAIRTGRPWIPAVVPVPGMPPAVVSRRRCNVGIRTARCGGPRKSTFDRPGWFYHPAEDARVRTVDSPVELYPRPSAGTRSCCSTSRRHATD